MDPLYFMDGIYRNVGKKIKLFGKLTLLVGPVVSITCAIINFVKAGDKKYEAIVQVGKGFNNILGGIGVSILISFVLFALGTIAESYIKEQPRAKRQPRPGYGRERYSPRDAQNGGYQAGENRTTAVNANTFCMNCGSPVAPGNTFCNNCGASVK